MVGPWLATLDWQHLAGLPGLVRAEGHDGGGVADVGHASGLQHALDRAILTHRTMKHGEEHVNIHRRGDRHQCLWTNDLLDRPITG